MIHCMCSTYSCCEHSIVRHVGYALDMQQPAVRTVILLLAYVTQSDAVLCRHRPPARPPACNTRTTAAKPAGEAEQLAVGSLWQTVDYVVCVVWGWDRIRIVQCVFQHGTAGEP
jgi:hypothetical protein